MPELLALLSRDGRESPRTAAARALGQIGILDPSQVRQLGAVLPDADVATGAAVLESLQSLGDRAKPALPSLLRACEDGSLRVRQLALDLVGTLALERDDVVLALVKGLADPQRLVRAVAERQLGRLVRPGG